jgi:hypothetical protein
MTSLPQHTERTSKNADEDNSPFSTDKIRDKLIDEDNRSTSEAVVQEENKFLGNSVQELKPSKVGEIKVLCYANQVPCLTVGPDCK